MESGLAEVGLLALEDPETDEILWVDTNDKSWQKAYQRRFQEMEIEKKRIFQGAKVDRIDISTELDYATPLTTFFKERARRLRH